GFDKIDSIKEELEKAYPGVVSCADIVSIATRDGIMLYGSVHLTCQKKKFNLSIEDDGLDSGPPFWVSTSPLQTHSIPMMPWMKKKAEWWSHYYLGTSFSSQGENQELWLDQAAWSP
ncbi:peroxidase 52, partial [Quercus suber]